MSMSLSFTEAFFIGTVPLDQIEESDEPTSVYQAIISMSAKDKIRLAEEVFGYKGQDAVYIVESEEWPSLVMDKVRETDRCGDASTPVDVYIDNEGYWTLDIYSNECDTCGTEIDHDCNGSRRCPDCDGPCPCCNDGPGPG